MQGAVGEALGRGYFDQSRADQKPLRARFGAAVKLPGWLGGVKDTSPGEEGEDAEAAETGSRTARERARSDREDRAAARRGIEARAARRAERRTSAERTRPERTRPSRPGRGAEEREAEERSIRSGASSAGKAFATALKQGAGETRGRSKGVPAQLGKQALGAAGVAFGIFFDLIGVVLGLALAIYARVSGPASRAVTVVRRGTVAASRALTPIRVLAAVVAGAAILLALSQFADYRGVSIGTDAYAEVATVAPAPERERSETGSAHGYAMVPVALVALALLVVAVRRRRWQLCRAIAAGGVAAIAIALIVDRPAGLDAGELELAYQGVEARLLGGFYAQIFAGLLLAAAALLLGRELRLAGAPSRAAGNERGRSRKRLPRRAPKPQGARA